MATGHAILINLHILQLYIQKQEIINIEGVHIKLPNAKKVEIEYLADL